MSLWYPFVTCLLIPIFIFFLLKGADYFRRWKSKKSPRKVLWKLLWNAWVSYGFSFLWSLFDIDICSKTLLSACPWFLWILFWQIYCMRNALPVGWKALVTTVLGLYCLREGKKNIGHVWLLYFLGGLRSLGTAGWSQWDHRKVFCLHIAGFLPIPFTEGKSGCWKVSSFLGQWLPAVLVFAQIVSVVASLTPGEPQWHLWVLHSHSEAAGSRASRAVWALSHWEFCHLNSSACFGGGKMGILDRRPALYQFALLPPLQSWKTASNFVFLQIHLQEESMAATWLWLMDGFDVVMNKTLKVKLSSDWIFSFNTPFVLLWLVKHKCRLRKFSWQKDFQFWWSPWSCVGFELFFLQVFVVLNSI